MTRTEAFLTLEHSIRHQLAQEQEQGTIDLKCLCSQDDASEPEYYALILANVLSKMHEVPDNMVVSDQR